jgi:hypothetical protein
MSCNIYILTSFAIYLMPAKRVSGRHALSAHRSCLQFAPGSSWIPWYPNTSFMPVSGNRLVAGWSLWLHPPLLPFTEVECLHRLCPAGAQRIFLDKSKSIALQRLRPLHFSVTGGPLPYYGYLWIVEDIVLENVIAIVTAQKATSWTLFLRHLLMGDLHF